MKKLLINLKVLTFLMTGAVSMSAKGNTRHQWVFFDLGDTIVNTKDKKGFHYFDGAKAYLESLRKMGLHIGIISNIPETFGMSYEEKLQTLKTLIQSKWNDKEQFDWSLFDEILLPLNNNELKPADILFLRALSRAGECPSIYISENEREVLKAESMGIAGHLFDKESQGMYVPLEILESYIDENYARPIPSECIL
ncbi:hypothetical protein HBN50_14975 [Halobacteriovorax sp. GB3]|uniref:hypothetical protein n=1 Tax=Halobacteriovorax sp. GB3 TaxID=2719615 RepID=UPI00235E5203|nr:hypothetical protein [Halobacteriovorax sp. GB3]MDD0854413.1 hypothetical protein [Halobacteriovorax sp. GB3]